MTDMVHIKVDGKPLEVPKGTLAIRACEQAGVYVPRFCDHPLLKPVAACRACLVEVAMPNRQGEVAKMPKPMPACSTTCTDRMEIYTQFSSEVAAKAQNGILEFLLINHPLDCPVCDKGGECPLQNQAFMEGNPTSRFTDQKRVWPKPVRLTSEILLDRERCVLCQRCVRFGKEIAGDAFIDLQGRGGGSSPLDPHHFMGENIGAFDTQVLGIYDEADNTDSHTLTACNAMVGPEGKPAVIAAKHAGNPDVGVRDVSGRRFASYFSGNITQICPVGALTNTSYRFRARPHDLISTPSVTDQDASGAAIRVDARRGVVLRHLAGDNPEVNEEWISDKDRYAFAWQSADDRLTRPMVRDAEGNLKVTDWGTALSAAARCVLEAKEANQETAFLPGGHLTLEDYYAWSKFAHVVAGSSLTDMRARDFRFDEMYFVRTRVAGRGLEVTYEDVETAPFILLLDFEPEDECATLFLRMRKAAQRGTKFATVAPYLTNGAKKLDAELVQTVPGTQIEMLKSLLEGSDDQAKRIQEALRQPGAIVFIGERACLVAGALDAAMDLVDETGVKWAWVPRRAGERAAIEAGCFPGLLPGGRLLNNPEARAEVAHVWGMKEPLKEANPFCIKWSFDKVIEGKVGTLVVGGVDLRDVEKPQLARDALAKATHVVQLEVRKSEVTDYAEVVLPVAPPHEKTGTFINWEGRLSPFGQALSTRALPDWKVMNLMAKAAGYDLGLDSVAAILEEYQSLAGWQGDRADAPYQEEQPVVHPEVGQAILATWKPLLDAGRCQDGEADLAGSARVPVVRMNAETAAENNITQYAKVSGERGSVTLPVVIDDLPPRVVWMPECSPGSKVRDTLGCAATQLVTLKAAEV